MVALASDLAIALDPVLLMRRLGLEPDAWQSDLLRSDAQRMLLLCSRQSGKSTAAAVLALHLALFRGPSLVLLAAPALRQAQEIFRAVAGFYGRLGETVPVEAESALRIELANGSRIIALPGNEATTRGYSNVALLVLDEAARIDDALYTALAPVLAVSRGRVILLSTPFGKRGVFHGLWTEGGTAWRRTKVTAEQCPRIPASFLEEQRRTMPRWSYEQEFLCVFHDDQLAAFSYEDVQAALSSDIEPLFGGCAS
jgi:hypothetical protein